MGKGFDIFQRKYTDGQQVHQKMPNITNYCVCVGAYVHLVISCVQLFTTPWTVAFQAPRYMELSR